MSLSFAETFRLQCLPKGVYNQRKFKGELNFLFFFNAGKQARRNIFSYSQRTPQSFFSNRIVYITRCTYIPCPTYPSMANVLKKILFFLSIHIQ